MIIEYKPTLVKLPVGLKREMIVRFNDRNEPISKAEVPNYDDYSLFYDVFFSLDKKYIWTVGPPLLSLKEKLFPVQILYKGRTLKYEYCDYSKSNASSCASCFKIPATSIKEKAPILTFSGRDWEIDIKVNYFPSVNDNEYELVLSSLQKDYSTSHVIDWILWHHRLHHFERFLFYDNGSDNVIEVKTALQNLNIPNLKIVFIDWSYYYGGYHSQHDLFAQNTQLNHTLRLYREQNYFIASWDLDEFLISTGSMTLQHLMKKKPYQVVERHNVVDTAKEPLSSIAECEVIQKKPILGKHLYRSDTVKYLGNPHTIGIRQSRFMYRPLFAFVQIFTFINILRHNRSEIYLYSRHKIFRTIFRRQSRFMDCLISICADILGSKRLGIINQDFYLVHTNPIKVFWKKPDLDKERPFKEVFDPRIHVKDDNIQKNLKKAKLR